MDSKNNWKWMGDIKALDETLRTVEQELENLNDESCIAFKNGFGIYSIGFPNTVANTAMLNKLDGLIHIATHEMATTIGFQRQNIVLLANYIEYLEEYKAFSESEIESIVGSETLPADVKLNLLKKISDQDKKELLDKITEMRTSWNRIFNNKSFKEKKSKLDKL